MKRCIAVLLAVTMCLGVAGCSKPDEAPVSIPNPQVTIELYDDLVMCAELYPSVAPNTVANFVNLIEEGFYDGLTFHRVVGGFVIQGGDPNGTGTGGPGYSIKGEFQSNGVENGLSHVRGVLSMARGNGNDSAGSQFFIMHGAATGLDGDYAAFGKLVGDESYDVLDRIANTATDALERPMIEYKIKKMTVDTQGYRYTVVKYEE